MANLNFPTSAGISSRSPSAAFQRAAAAPQEVFISLGDSAKKANIVRDDFSVPIVEIDPDLFDDFFGGRPHIVNKVVSQSIPAGTVVNEGTAVDLVMAPASSIPGRIFQGGHGTLREQTMEDVYNRYIDGNVEVARMLSRRTSAAQLTAEDVNVIRQVAERNDISIGDEIGERPEDVFVSWQFANTFAH